MPYVIITKDKPDSLALREEVRGVHLAYLTDNKTKLLAAGAQTADDGTGGTGGVIIVDTEDRAEAEAFIQNDPFTKVGRLTPASIADGERDRPLDKKAEGKGDDVEVEQGTCQHRSGSSQVANGCRPRVPDEPVPVNVRLGRSHFSAPAVPKASAWSWAAGHGNKSDRCS
jgi:uncharacterized protein